MGDPVTKLTEALMEGCTDSVKARELARSFLPDAWQQRRAVGQWWRIKTAQDNQDTRMLRTALGDQYDHVTSQLAADIDHSSLLQRLLAGEEPEER